MRNIIMKQENKMRNTVNDRTIYLVYHPTIFKKHKKLLV